MRHIPASDTAHAGVLSFEEALIPTAADFDRGSWLYVPDHYSEYRYLLGTRGSTISYVVYLLLGAVGLPVFSGYQGGLGKLAGPTGGYLAGFILMAIISGVFLEKSGCNTVITGLGMVLGTAVAYLFGTIWFVFEMQCELWYALTVCVFPFIPFDLGKIVIAAVLGQAIRSALVKSNLLPTQG